MFPRLIACPIGCACVLAAACATVSDAQSVHHSAASMVIGPTVQVSSGLAHLRHDESLAAGDPVLDQGRDLKSQLLNLDVRVYAAGN